MRNILAHVVHNEETIADKLLHPLTGFDHIASMVFVATGIVLLFLALRGRRAATTAGTVTRVRSTTFVAGSAALLVASIIALFAI